MAQPQQSEPQGGGWIERSGRALDHIEALQEIGTPEQVQAAWDMYQKYQTGTWEA